MPRPRLILPSVENSVPAPKRKDNFRTIGEALTQHEAERVTNPTGWLLDRLGL